MNEDAAQWQPDQMPAMLISTAARLLAKTAETRFRTIGISISQFPVLAALRDGARLSQKELTRLAGVEQPSMAQLLARMERDGLIERSPDPLDGRSSLIALTDGAMQLIGPSRTIFAQGNKEALKDFDDKDVRLLLSLLSRLIANLGGSDI